MTEQPAPPSIADKTAGRNATIFRLVQSGDTESLQMHLESNPAAIHHRDALGRTPLHQAVIEGQIEICQMLVDRGANVAAQDENGQTPFLLGLVGDDVVAREREARERLRDGEHWIPPHAWCTKNVWSLAITGGLVSWLLMMLLLAAVNPRIPFFVDWNSIDHVDLLPEGHKIDVRKLCVSGNKLCWIDGSGNVGVLNRGTRVWDWATSGSFADVSPGDEAGDFVLLDAAGLHQMKEGFTGYSTDSWGAPSSTWPVSPQARPSGPPEVLGARLTKRGVTIAVQGVGINHYSLGGSRSNWTNSELSKQPIDQVVITKERIVFSLEGGGLGIGDLDDLSLIAEVSTPEIVRLAADEKQDWAEAIDTSGGLWLAPRQAMAWYGPFYSAAGQAVGGPSSVRDIRAVSLHGRNGYMGTPDGLFCYSLDRRRVVPLIPNESTSTILPLSTFDGGAGGVLVQGERGIWFADGTDSTHRRLDEGRISDLSMSDDGRLAAFLRRSGVRSRPDVRVVFSPSSPKPEITSVCSAKAWRNVPPASLNIRGVVQHNNYLVFATSHGGFLLDPSTRTYTDASRVWKRDSASLAGLLSSSSSSLDWVNNVGKNVVASADGVPVIFHAPDSSWRVLDPSLKEKLQSSTGTDEHIVGLGATGALYDFGDGTTQRAMRFCTGKVSSLGNATTERRPGDLAVTDDDHWRVTFGKSGKLVDYHSATGNIREHELPNNGTSIIQLRLDKAGYRLLAADGSVFDGEGKLLFGPSNIDFDPYATTALVAGPLPDRVFLAHQRQILLYDWCRGHVTDHSAGIPEDFGNVRELSLIGDALVVGSDTNRLLYGRPADSGRREWTEFPRFQRFAISQDQTEVFLAGTDGMAKVDAHSLAKRKVPPEPTWCVGENMQEFVAHAAHAWNLSEQVTAFFPSQGPEVGIFDTRDESWKIIQLRELEGSFAPDDSNREFATSAKGHLAIRQGSRIVAIQSESGVPPHAASYSTEREPSEAELQWNDEVLRYVYVTQQHELRVGHMTPFDPSGSSVPGSERIRGGDSSGIDTRDIVFVKAHGDHRFRMLNAHGGIGIYDIARGIWKIERSEVPGQKLHRWFGSDDRRIWLLLDSLDNTSQMVTLELRGGELTETESIRFPTSATQLLTWLAHPEQREEPLLQESFASIKPLLARDWSVLQPVAGAEWALPDGSLRMVRSPSGTRLLLPGGGILTSSPQGGFVQDRYQDVAWDADGRIWALHKGAPKQLSAVITTPEGVCLPGEVVSFAQLVGAIDSTVASQVRIHLDNKVVRHFVRSKTSALLREPPDETQIAELRYGKWRLSWLLDGSESVKGRWTGPNDERLLRLWSDRGKLATQVVRQVVLADDKVLLLATPLGLIARSAKTFEVVSLFPGIQNIDLLQGTDRQRIVVVADGKSYLWASDAMQLAPGSDELSVLDEALTGPWRWSIRRASRQLSSARILHTQSLNPRVVMTTEKGWAFADDRVHWLCRDIKDSAGIWLATDAGLWLTDEGGQRVAGVATQLPTQSIRQVRCMQDGNWQGRSPDGHWFAFSPDESVGRAINRPEGQEAMVHSPGLTISCSEGYVTLQAQDTPLFTDGRFFFDRQAAIQSHDGALYCVAGQNRWLVKRSIKAPGSVTGCWRLPLTVPADADLDLEVRDDQMVLRATINAERYLAWKIDVGTAEPIFAPWEDYDVATLLADLAVWRTTPSGDFRPYLPDSRNQPLAFWSAADAAALGLREVSEFWSGDRFAWDEIEAVGLVGDRDLIGTTPLGLVWIRPTPAAAPALGLAQIDGLQGVQPAIDSLGKKRGLLAAIEDSPTIFVQAHSESPPDIERITVTSPYTHAARLRFAYEGLGEEQSLRLGQYWTSQQESGSEFLVSSELPSVPNDELLLDGQFVFDVSDAACQVDNDRWLTIRSIPHTPEPSFWVRLERLTQFGHLESIDCWRIDGCNGFPIAIRSESSPTQEARASVACSRAGGDLSFYEVRMKLQISADAAERSNEEARQRFAVGQNVFLDTENLNWSSESRDFGSHELPLTSRPAEFPVLVCQDDGVQMSFDVFRSLAIRPLSGNRSELALGTRGGLHFYSIENGIAPTFGKPDRVVFLEDASGVDADATRVRVVDDTTWALFGERQQWVAFHGYSRVVTENSLIPPLEGDGKRVVFQPNGGVQIGTSLHTHSNDAWWLGRQPLGNLTDFYFDPICRELWISCEEEAALFRIVLDAF